jgi:hypothetical protein
VRVALKEAATVKESVYSILLKKRPLCHFDEGEIYSSEYTANDYLSTITINRSLLPRDDKGNGSGLNEH